ncbi:hypothetical protein MSMEG_6166 [Mycolicibacterium smegmatis MC2 155]|uniref:Uncharacterized protein n=1 Tax=Mycolicibacterium smegmatis (strain ATCC 700084 / mc(2)155) TaxID=246196 RepID=A0R5E6_MYCS2|nr:hypothetical protein MSMEG_6166 [Mycolicibacterium smegmatis MC2 155]
MKSLREIARNVAEASHSRNVSPHRAGTRGCPGRTDVPAPQRDGHLDREHHIEILDPARRDTAAHPAGDLPGLFTRRRGPGRHDIRRRQCRQIGSRLGPVPRHHRGTEIGETACEDQECGDHRDRDDTGHATLVRRQVPGPMPPRQRW